MNPQGTLFQDGATRKQRGVDRSLDNESPEFLAEALSVIRDLASEGLSFSADDVRTLTLRVPHHDNAWGAVVSHAATNLGIIKRVGFTPSVRPQAHGRMVSLWASA